MAGTERARAVVIGGGVVGCAVLRELTRNGIEALLVEAEPDVGEGASKANSAIVHTGFDAHAGTLEARLVRRAAALWPDLVEELGVPFLAVGALMVARNENERGRLESEVRANATALGVETEILGRDALHEIAPYLHEDVIAALAVPGESVVDPFWLTRAYAEAAIAGGAGVRTDAPVVGVAVRDDDVEVRLEDGTTIRTEQAFDCAGVRADEIARLAGDDSFAITPRKGEFLVSEETYHVDRIVLPIPGPMGKGMLVTPIVFGGLLLGPTAVDQVDKDDRSTDPAERDRIVASCRSMVPALDGVRPIRAFAGLRTVSSTGDYILRPSTAGDRLWIVAGIRSTGVTGSPAIAERVVGEAMAARGWRPRAAPRALSPQPPAELDPGVVVCVCRSISRGEILGACRRPTAPRTIDALKRRGGVTFGDCQGSLCLVDAAAILAGERGVAISAVDRGRRGSWIFREAPAGTASAPSRGTPPLPGSADVVVVGGGRAGAAAASSIRSAGADIAVVERRDGRTAIGLVEDSANWLVLVQTAHGAAEIRARMVVLATGGFVEPREHRRIAGPRPSGIVTSDLVAAALAAGLLPGSRVLVVGTGSTAAGIAAALAAAGAEIVGRLAAEPAEVRGERRLEAIRDGERWIACDTLVLADRRLPQPFLLRGLGLVDGRPGVPAPVDAEGRLSRPGLWAAGCCAAPDIDHRACVADGARVGAAVVAELGGGRA